MTGSNKIGKELIANQNTLFSGTLSRSTSITVNLNLIQENVKNLVNLNPWLSLSQCRNSLTFTLNSVLTTERILSHDLNTKYNYNVVEYRPRTEVQSMEFNPHLSNEYSVPVEIILWEPFDLWQFPAMSSCLLPVEKLRPYDYCRTDFRTICDDSGTARDSKYLPLAKQAFFATVQDFQINSVCN